MQKSLKKISILFVVFSAVLSAQSRENINTPTLEFSIATDRPEWSVSMPGGELLLNKIQPTFSIAGLHPSQMSQNFVLERKEISHPDFGKVVQYLASFGPANGPTFRYEINVHEILPEIYVRLGLRNTTDKPLQVRTLTPVRLFNPVLTGFAADWHYLGDGRKYRDAGKNGQLDAAFTEPEIFWWYAAFQNRKERKAFLLGGLENNKGMNSQTLVRRDDTLMISASQVYEGITMPVGGEIQGEYLLVYLGERGSDAMHRLGSMTAQLHDVDLFAWTPVDPVTMTFHEGTGDNIGNYGAAMLHDFEYKKVNPKAKGGHQDREWTAKNTAAGLNLGIGRFGYDGNFHGLPPVSKVVRRPAPFRPLARSYGRVDWLYQEQTASIAEENPQWYINNKIDFSHPEVIAFERERVVEAFAARHGARVSYNWDFVSEWRYLPGQYDPFMTSAETYRTAMGLWREAALNHPHGAWASVFMNVFGLNFGLVDTIRVGEDSDHGYYSHPNDSMNRTLIDGLASHASARWHYNGKLWWTDPDSFKVWAGGTYTFGMGKVHATFCTMIGFRVSIAEPFYEYDEPYPPDRLEIIKRVSPGTADTSEAIDMFENLPARIWNLPVQRPWMSWNVVGLFHFDPQNQGQPIRIALNFYDLGLDPAKEYLIYEFWTNTFLGVHEGSINRTIAPVDVEVLSIVERKNHPQLISTNRHVRQMAWDIRALLWNSSNKTLSGKSLVVKDDPYELRIHVPAGFSPVRFSCSVPSAQMNMEGYILKLSFTAESSTMVDWGVTFEKSLSGLPREQE